MRIQASDGCPCRADATAPLRCHAERFRTRLDAARLPPSPWGCSAGVETGVDTDALAQRMLDEGYLLPGALFHAERKPSTLVRINFATKQEAAFYKTFVGGRAVQGR